MPGLKLLTKRAAIGLCKSVERSPRRDLDAVVTLMHEVGGAASAYSISRPVFRAQLNYLLEQEVDWYLATELAEATPHLNTNAGICVTFDDGRLSAYDATLEILDANARCTHFIIPGRVDCKDENTMSWSQIRELDAAGVEIGSHSMTHPYLTRLAQRDLENELSTSKSVLEDKLGKAVTSFAYPYGDFDMRVVDAVQQGGYQCAFTTRHLYASREIDVFQVPRFEPLESLNHLVEIYQGRAYWFYRLLGKCYMYRDRLKPW